MSHNVSVGGLLGAAPFWGKGHFWGEKNVVEEKTVGRKSIMSEGIMRGAHERDT
jgi:hypothetical protein